MEKVEQTIYVIDHLVDQNSTPIAFVSFTRIGTEQLARRSKLDSIIEKETTSLNEEFEPLKEQDYGLYVQRRNEAFTQRVDPLYTERKKVEGTSEGSFWVPAGRYKEGQVLNAVPQDAIPFNDLDSLEGLSNLLELYKPQNIQERKKLLTKYKEFFKPEEVRLINNLLVYLEQSKI